MQKDFIAVKKEEVGEKSTPACRRTVKNKGKEPVRQTAPEEASDMPEDDLMEDNEHIFGTFTTATIVFLILI